MHFTMLRKSDAKPQDFHIITFIGHSEKCKIKNKLDKNKSRLAATRD